MDKDMEMNRENKKKTEKRVLCGRYEVQKLLGNGGSGVVYRVLDLHTERILAVKEIGTDTEKEVKMAEREAIILQSCFHPYLPVVLETFRENGFYYTVMEYVEGITLKEYVEKNGRMTVEKMLHFAKKIGEVLLYLHNRKPAIVYGDLKPQNIMVTKEEEIRLIDFGTARGQEGESVREGCYASPGYAAPEQKRGYSADWRSDLYSFGATLHYLLTGEDPEQPPYRRRSLRECDSALPVGICWAIEKCLKEKPEERYHSLEQFLYDLRHFTKREKSKRIMWQLKQSVQALLFLAFAASFYRFFENGQWGVTWKDNEALFPMFFFLCAGVLWRTFILNGGKRWRYAYRLEKNVWKTDKKGVGLFAFLVLMGVYGLSVGVSAKERENSLSVTIYDEAGYKLLWPDNQVNQLAGPFRMEIPKSCFAEGEEYEITVTLTDKKSGKISAKQFAVKTVKSSIEN